MDPAGSKTGSPPRPKRAWVYFCLVLFVLPVLCATLILRFLDLGDWQTKKPAFSFIICVAILAMKCATDLANKTLDNEGRLLSVAGFIPIILFLFGFFIPAPIAMGLLALAIVTLVAGLVAAFVAGRKKPGL